MEFIELMLAAAVNSKNAITDQLSTDLKKKSTQPGLCNIDPVPNGNQSTTSIRHTAEKDTNPLMSILIKQEKESLSRLDMSIHNYLECRAEIQGCGSANETILFKPDAPFSRAGSCGTRPSPPRSL